MAIYGLVGEKLGHSFSPLIHQQLADYDYQLFTVAPRELAAFIQHKQYDGLNITIPYKQAVLPFCHQLTEAARKIGSVNTIIQRADHTLLGHNTDYSGFAQLAQKTGIDFAAKNVVILGSGGTSHTVQAVVQDSGAKKITVISRQGANNYTNLSQQQDAEIIINTTPVGMFPHSEKQPLSLADFPHCQGVLDVIYNPLRTRLVLAAERQQLPCSGGLYMLVAQAKDACQLFTGQTIPAAKTDEIYRNLLQSLTNLVLIGMPGCGKSTIGQLLAVATGKELLDIDQLIMQQVGLPIAQIFSHRGEAYFRQVEKQIIAEVGQQTNKIIATGGGAVLDPDNYWSLAQNGKIYFLQRQTAALAQEGRPLSQGIAALHHLAQERLPLYRQYAHQVIDNNGSPTAAVAAICQDFGLPQPKTT